MPAGQLREMFQPFRRLSNSAERHGAGLGLAIAERAIRLHGGTINAENHPQGGLSVTIELPIAANVGTRDSIP